jgi:hypothetical protein
MSKKQTPIAFLAHNSLDKSQVRVIADRLNRKGIETWLDEEQIPPGISFHWELKSFFSKLVNDSIPIIPVLLPGVESIPADLIFLKELNWVKFSDGLEDSAAIDNLIWGITGKRIDTDYSTLETHLAELKIPGISI